MRSTIFRAGIVVSVAFAGACGAKTPPPKAEPSDPGDSLGHTGATAALPSDDAGAAPVAPAPDAGGDLPADVKVLAKGQPSGLAVDDTSVYFVNAPEGSVMRVGKNGGVVEIAYSAPSPFTGAAFSAVDAKSLYVAAGSVVFSLDKQGGATPTTLASQVRDPLRALAVDATTVYWVSGDNVMKVAKSGGAPAAVAAVQNNVTSVGADAKHVYWSTAGDGTIWRAAARGADVVVRGADKPGCLAFDDASVYFCAGANVMKAPKSGGAATALATTDATVTHVTLDGTHAYYATSKGTVGRAVKAGGAADALVTGLGAVTSLVVDGQAVYFATRGTEEKKMRDGGVMRKGK